jgi:hypothetical protein
MTDSAELKRVAEAATPGPYRVVDNRDMNGAWWIEAPHPEGFHVSIAEVRSGCEEAQDIGSAKRDAAFIAACDPTTILALIAERDRLREALAETRLLVDEAESNRGPDTDFAFRLGIIGKIARKALT